MRKTSGLVLALLLAPAVAFAGPPPAPPPPGAPSGNAPAAGDDTAAAADDVDDPNAPTDIAALLTQVGMHPQEGPKKIALGKNLTINLPAGYVLIDAANSKAFAKLQHNLPDDRVLGTVLRKDNGKWFVEVSYEDEGYIKDDDWEKIDSDAILQSYKDGTEEENKARKEQGWEAVHIGGWAEAPRYEQAVHHVVWGLIVTNDLGGKSVNFNTRILGRHGFASLNLIGPLDMLAQAKPDVTALLSATTFDEGSKYENFDPKTDKVAEYGLAALIAGGAGAAALKLVKVGLLAKFGAVILKGCAAGGKAIILVILAAFAAVKRFFGKLFGGKQATTTVSAPPASGSDLSGNPFAAAPTAAAGGDADKPASGSDGSGDGSGDGSPPPAV